MTETRQPGNALRRLTIKPERGRCPYGPTSTARRLYWHPAAHHQTGLVWAHLQCRVPGPSPKKIYYAEKALAMGLKSFLTPRRPAGVCRVHLGKRSRNPGLPLQRRFNLRILDVQYQPYEVLPSFVPYGYPIVSCTLHFLPSDSRTMKACMGLWNTLSVPSEGA